MLDEDRFYVRESTGYLAPTTYTAARQFTEVMILDRSYCHKVAWTSLAVAPRYRNGVLHGYHRDLPIYRRAAKRLCAEWNAQDRTRVAHTGNARSPHGQTERARPTP